MKKEFKNYLIYFLIFCIWIIVEYGIFYLFGFLFEFFVYIALVIFLLILSIRNLILLIRRWKTSRNLRLIKLIIPLILFILTFYRFNYFPNLVYEKIDWNIHYNKRVEVISKVKTGEFKPNVPWNNWVCELPFEYPIISNDGNDIGISKNEKTNKFTVSFWIDRAFLDTPSTYLIYSEDLETLKKLDEKVKNEPERNWKIKDNWYRIFGEYYF